MSQTERGGKSAELRVVSGRGIIDDFDLPMVLGISNGKVAVAGDFPVSLGDRSGNLVRVEVAAGLSMNKADDVAVTDVSDLLIFGVVIGLLSVGVEEPIVVGVLVVVASDLLLLGAFRESLDVGVEKTATVAHVLESSARANGDLKRAILADFSAAKVGLEERRHLRIARTTVLQNEEVDVEREQVDDERDHDKANDPKDEVRRKLDLQCC